MTFSQFNPWRRVIFYPKGISPPAAPSFPVLKVGGDSNIATPTHPSLSVRIYFILPDLSFLDFWNIPLPWCPQVLFGGGGCLFIVGFPHPNLLSKPCPQAQSPPPQFQGLWLLVTPIMAPHCIKPIGNNLLSSSSRILAACVPPTPTLFQRRQQPVASYLSGVTPSCHLLTAAAPALPRQTQYPSWSSVVTLGLQHPEGISDAVHRPL